MKEIVFKTVVGIVLTATWGFCIAAIKKAHKRQKATEEGLRSLLRAEIIRTYDKTKERGYCPIYSKEALTHCFEAYSDLDGNGTMPGLYDFVMASPTDKPKL